MAAMQIFDRVQHALVGPYLCLKSYASTLSNVVVPKYAA